MPPSRNAIPAPMSRSITGPFEAMMLYENVHSISAIPHTITVALLSRLDLKTSVFELSIDIIAVSCKVLTFGMYLLNFY